MIPQKTPAAVFLFRIAAGCLALSTAASGQSLYLVRKSQVYLQTNAVASGTSLSLSLAAPPSGAYIFTAQAAFPVALTLPTSGTQALVPWPGSGTFALVRGFSTLAALEAAFPNGGYRMSGAGLPPLLLTLTPDSYPSTPGVLRTGWSNGLLVLDPAQSNSLSFGGNSSFSTAALGGHARLRITGLSDDVSLGNEIWSRPVLGFPATSTSFSSFTIPANTLTAGRVYFGELVWDIATTLDTTTIPDGAVLALYSRVQRFFIVARATSDVPPPPPVISTQPTSQSVFAGRSATFTLGIAVGGAVPTGVGVPSVIWCFEGERLNIDGAKYALLDGRSLRINNVDATDFGRYFAYVVNPGGVVTTLAAGISLLPEPPSIARAPAPLTVAAGSTAVFSVAAGGTGPLTYQWRLNGRNVPATFPGANGPILVVPNAGPAQEGAYSVIVSNSLGTMPSAPAALTIAPPTNDPGRLINLSILTPLRAGETMTMGAVLGGAGTAGRMPLLARAAGPALAPLGVGDFLPDPAMTLNFTSPTPAVVVAGNDDWGGGAALGAAFTSVGAFPFANAESKDAALFQGDASALAPGNYTVEVRDAAGGSGTVIAELYDATPPRALTATPPRLINVSVLKSIATGTTLTAGFVVGGTTAKTVLIRAIGPGLAPLGVSAPMPDPQMTLNYTTPTPATVVSANNDWGGDPALAQVAGRVGAFPIANLSSRDAMLLVTLAPGNYTAGVSPAPGTPGGTAIVEVYEVP